jgi:hypothetical protein
VEVVAVAYVVFPLEEFTMKLKFSAIVFLFLGCNLPTRQPTWEESVCQPELDTNPFQVGAGYKIPASGEIDVAYSPDVPRERINELYVGAELLTLHVRSIKEVNPKDTHDGEHLYISSKCKDIDVPYNYVAFARRGSGIVIQNEELFVQSAYQRFAHELMHIAVREEENYHTLEKTSVFNTIDGYWYPANPSTEDIAKVERGLGE